MDKEILFRGKHIGTGEWVYGDMLVDPYHTWIYERNDKIPTIGAKVDPKTVSQYTGFRSAVGNRIFFDDIVKIKAERSVNGRRQSKHDHTVDLFVVVTEETMWNWNHFGWKYKDDKYVLPTKEDYPQYPNCQELLVEKGLELVDRTIGARPIRDLLLGYERDLQNAQKQPDRKIWLEQANRQAVVIIGNIHDGVVAE